MPIKLRANRGYLQKDTKLPCILPNACSTSMVVCCSVIFHFRVPWHMAPPTGTALTCRKVSLLYHFQGYLSTFPFPSREPMTISPDFWRGRCVSMHPSISLQRFHCFKGVLLLRIIRYIPYMVQRHPTFTSLGDSGTIPSPSSSNHRVTPGIHKARKQFASRRATRTSSLRTSARCVNLITGFSPRLAFEPPA